MVGAAFAVTGAELEAALVLAVLDADADADADAELRTEDAELNAEDAEETAEERDELNALPVADAEPDPDTLVLVRILTTPPGLIELNALPVSLAVAAVVLKTPPGLIDVTTVTAVAPSVVTLPVKAVADQAAQRPRPIEAAAARSGPEQAVMIQGVASDWMAA